MINILISSFFPRLYGSYANLYLGGRRHIFSDRVRADMIAHLRSQNPDVVLISGDISSTALEREYEMARRDLQGTYLYCVVRPSQSLTPSRIH